MARKSLKYPQGIVECINATYGRGTILAAKSGAGVNGMTIGWIHAGFAWGRPCVTVMVRPSRHTHKVIEQADSFTVSVLPKSLQAAVDLFGTKSGRDMDKFEAAKITAAKAESVDSVYVKEATLVIECKISFKQPMDATLISADYVKKCYGSGDYHTLYFGEVTAIHGK